MGADYLRCQSSNLRWLGKLQGQPGAIMSGMTQRVNSRILYEAAAKRNVEKFPWGYGEAWLARVEET